MNKMFIKKWQEDKWQRGQNNRQTGICQILLNKPKYDKKFYLKRQKILFEKTKFVTKIEN